MTGRVQHTPKYLFVPKRNIESHGYLKWFTKLTVPFETVELYTMLSGGEK